MRVISLSTMPCNLVRERFAEWHRRCGGRAASEERAWAGYKRTQPAYRNLPTMPEELFVPAFVPVLACTLEPSAEGERIGGSPGLYPDEAWPELEAAPATFVMQFWDPRPGARRVFWQLFVPRLDLIETGQEEVLLRTVPEPRELVLREPPRDAEPYPLEACGDIVGWRTHVDLQVNAAYTYLEERGLDSAALEEVNNAAGVKIAGVGASSQGRDYALFIQNLFYEDWGDGGSLHVSEDGQLDGDMG
jgi:hypothetical protein